MSKVMSLSAALVVSALIIGPTHSEMSKLAGIALLAGFLALHLRFLLSRFELGLLLASVGAMWLASAFALEPMTSVLGTPNRAQASLAALALAVFAMSASELNSRQRDCLYRVIAVLGALIGLYALMQRAGLDPLTWADSIPGRPAATLSNAVVVGGYLALCLPLTLRLAHVAWLHTRRVPLVLFSAASVFQIFGLVACGTRSAVLALAIVGALLLMLRRRRVRAWLLPTLALGLVLVAWAGSQRIDSLSDRAQLWANAARALQTETPLRDLNGERDNLHAWRGLIGFGPDMQQTPLRAARVDTAGVRAEAAQLQADRAHQWVLDRWLESGVLGLLVSLALAGGVAWRLREGMTSGNADFGSEAWALAAALGAWCLHLQFNFALTGDRSLAWVLIGCALALPQPAMPSMAVFRSARAMRWAVRLSFAAVLIAGAVAASGLVRGMNPSIDAERAFFAGQQRYLAAMAEPSRAAAPLFSQSAQQFETAASIRPFDTDAALAAASAWIEAAQSGTDVRALQSAQFWLTAVGRMDSREPRLAAIEARRKAVTAALEAASQGQANDPQLNKLGGG